MTTEKTLNKKYQTLNNKYIKLDNSVNYKTSDFDADIISDKLEKIQIEMSKISDKMEELGYID